MTLKAPFQISSRLQPAIKIDGCTISFDGKDCSFWFDFDNGYTHHERGFSPGAMRRNSEGEFVQGCFASIFSFASACGEGYAFEMRNKGMKSENSDLFPKKMREWCYRNEDELSSYSMEFEESKECLIAD